MRLRSTLSEHFRWTRCRRRILIGSGSEVGLCVEAHENLKKEDIKSRFVSILSWKIFEQQSAENQESVLPTEIIARIPVEQATTYGWSRYTGLRGKRIGMKTFGASAPLKELQKKFDFSVESLMSEAQNLIGK